MNISLAILALLFSLVFPAIVQAVEHPFLRWTPDEAAAIRQRIE